MHQFAHFLVLWIVQKYGPDEVGNGSIILNQNTLGVFLPKIC